MTSAQPVTVDDPALRKTRSAKGEQARKKLKRACIQVLERVGYHEMKVTDVTKEAGVAAGLFYHYFKDLKSLTFEVLTDFVSESGNLEAIEKNVAKGDWYERIYAHNLFVAKNYAARPGLMRSLLQLADEEQSFSKLLRSNYIEQLKWLVKLMPTMFPDSEQTEHEALMVIYTLSASSEVLLRDYFINCDPELTAESLEVEEITELLSVMFYRGLFLQNPPQEKLTYTKKLAQVVRS
jgi:AcrR family transcriptional regulator